MHYADIVVSFDIETTTILQEVGRDYGFMYIWQMAVDDTVVMGRTWNEWTVFLERLEECIGLNGRRLVIWVHFLGFEFQFFRNFIQIDEVFARKPRKPIWVRSGNIEFRCSMMLSNMGLKKFTQKTPGVTHVKMDGEEFDYSVLRYPDTELTDMELWYCVCDVLGLNECIKHYLKEDTLATIPLTSTGFVRRDYKEKCINDSNHMRQFRNNAITNSIYILLKEASRGAIAGSSHLWTDETLEEVDSFDIKSSYPYQMATKYFPQGKFIQTKISKDCGLFRTLIDNYCCIITWACEDIKLKRWSGIPYISKSKCRAVEGCRTGNGKVYSAKRIGMTCTEIDFRIIEEDYAFRNMEILEMWYAPRGALSKSFREHLLEMFQTKTDLDYPGADKFMYDKYKNKINASFGMMLTDIVHTDVLYDPLRIRNKKKVWYEEKPADVDALLSKYYNGRYNFLSYQHGVWVLAHGRDSLHAGMKIVGGDLVQVDTDSVKTLGEYKDKFELLNSSIKEHAETFDVKPYAMQNGKKIYLGVWEHEDKGSGDEYTYQQFRTLGAKKYCYINNEHMEITVAGLAKKAGGWLYEHGGIDAFTNGTDVPTNISGRTASTYNDLDTPVLRYINGHEVYMGSNIGVRNVKYTFGVTSEWLELIAEGKVGIDDNAPEAGAYENLKYDV